MEDKMKKFINSNAFQKFLTFGVLILLFVIFSIASPNFLTPSNVNSILLATAVNGILAVGVTFVIITSGIDLSIGTGMTLTAVTTGLFVVKFGVPAWAGIFVGLAAGALIGLINGVIIAKLKVPAFIATLGMMMVAKGLSLILSGAKPFYFDLQPDAAGFVFQDLAKATFLPGILDIPMGAIIFLLAAVIAAVILNKTILGRYNFAIGSNEQATKLSGINTDKWLIAIHVLTGVFVGLAGVIMASRLNSAQPALGQGYELDAIAAVVIGGTSLSGGKGGILGTVIGAFLMSTLLNGLRILSVPQEWQTVFTGAIVIIAVFIDIYRRSKNAKA